MNGPFSFMRKTKPPNHIILTVMDYCFFNTNTISIFAQQRMVLVIFMLKLFVLIPASVLISLLKFCLSGNTIMVVESNIVVKLQSTKFSSSPCLTKPLAGVMSTAFIQIKTDVRGYPQLYSSNLSFHSIQSNNPFWKTVTVHSEPPSFSSHQCWPIFDDMWVITLGLVRNRLSLNPRTTPNTHLLSLHIRALYGASRSVQTWIPASGESFKLPPHVVYIQHTCHINNKPLSYINQQQHSSVHPNFSEDIPPQVQRRNSINIFFSTRYNQCPYNKQPPAFHVCFSYGYFWAKSLV